MRVIPVIDILNGQAVHAIKGERANYRPVESVLCKSSDPVALVTAFRDRLGLSEIYVADLNAIMGSDEPSHRQAIMALAHEERMRVLLDAGISDIEQARKWLNLGVRKVVIGSETLREENALHDIPAGIEYDRLVFSLDLHDGRILSECHDFALMPPGQALQHLLACGWHEVILLDLRRVGSGEGVDRGLIAESRMVCPDLHLVAGGGINSCQELMELKSMGLAGALVATALHRGMITAQHISALGIAN